MHTLQDARPSGLNGKAKHTVTIEPQPNGGQAIVERYGFGFKRICAYDVDLRPGTPIEYAARRIAEAYEAEFVNVDQPAPGYSKAREIPVDIVDVGDLIAITSKDSSDVAWVSVTWVDDCRGEFCPQVVGACAGVVGLADGTERHYDVVDRPTVRIPCEVIA